MQNILITGGLGFIGKNVATHLLKRGNFVTILDRLDPSQSTFLNSEENSDIKYLRHDLCDYNNLPKLIENYEIIIHLAAVSDTRESLNNPRIDLDISLVAVWNIVEAAKECGRKPHIIFPSSQHVYGPSQYENEIRNEESLLNPVSSYAAAKIGAEACIKAYSNNYGIRSSILRLSNIVGMYQNFGVLTDVIRKLRENPNELKLWGNGQQRRNFLHVSDLCAAIEFFLGSSQESFSLVNVGNIKSISVMQLAEIAVNAIGIKNCNISPSTESEISWIGDPGSSLVDTKKLSGMGWSPELNPSEAVRLATTEIWSSL